MGCYLGCCLVRFRGPNQGSGITAFGEVQVLLQISSRTPQRVLSIGVLSRWGAERALLESRNLSRSVLET